MSEEALAVVEMEPEDREPERSRLPAIQREKVGGLLRPVAKPEDVLAAQEETRTLVEKALQLNRDYGKIPGTSKPTLLKPGAERINAAFGVRPRYRIDDREIDHDREVQWTKRKKKWENGNFAGWEEESGVSHGLYRYVFECELIHRESGVPVGQGMGSCSTMEAKYVDRPRECENVVLKMAQKRALIAATLNAYGLSDQFTQDMEDLAAEEEPFAMDAPVGFGKHSEKTWAELVEKEAGYVRWAIENVDRLSEDAKAQLRAALDKGEEVGREALEDARKPATEEKASADQIAQIRGHMDTAQVSEEEREKMEALIDGGISRGAAAAAISRLEVKIAEKEAGEGDGFFFTEEEKAVPKKDELRQDIVGIVEEMAWHWEKVERLTDEALDQEHDPKEWKGQSWADVFMALPLADCQKIHAYIVQQAAKESEDG